MSNREMVEFFLGINHPLKGVDAQSPLQKVMNPADLKDENTLHLVNDLGFKGAKRLPDGSYAGILSLMSTAAIAMDVREGGCFQRRYCFKDLNDCLAAYEHLQTRDDVPEGWIARRPEMPEDHEREMEKLRAMRRESERKAREEDLGFEP